MKTSAFTQQKVPFYINRNFALLWGGQAISNLGDFVFDTTLILWIATIIARNQSWAPLAVSGVLLVTTLPTFLFGPIAGVFVDRWDKRATMLRMDALRAILILLLVLTTGIIPLPFLPAGRLPLLWQLGSIYVVVFVTTLCAQFFNPARFALIGDVVEERYRARASGLGQTTMNLAILLGPPLAAPFLFTVGVQWALILNALSFVVSFVAVFLVRMSRQEEKNAPQQPHFWIEFREGVGFFIQSSPLMTLFIATIIAALGTGALNTLDVFFVTQNLHVPATLYGLMGMTFGAGSILGALLSSVIAQRIGVVRTLWLGFLIGGFLILLYARLTSFLPALLLYTLLGLFVTVTNTAIGPLLLQVIPHRLLGRVISVYNPGVSLASLLSIVLVGYLSSMVLHNFHASFLGIALGPIDTIFTATGLLIIAGGCFALMRLQNIQQPKSELAFPHKHVGVEEN